MESLRFITLGLILGVAGCSVGESRADGPADGERGIQAFKK